MLSLVVSRRRRCIFLGSCMAAWGSTCSGLLHLALRPEGGDARGHERGRPAGQPCRPVHACMHRMVPMGLGGSRGHACMHGRASGLSLSRAQTRLVFIHRRKQYLCRVSYALLRVKYRSLGKEALCRAPLSAK
jgi:hypothetical protein